MNLKSLCAVLLSGLALAACGGDDDVPASLNEASEQVTLQVTALEPFAFDPGALETDSGEITIEMESPEDLQAPHAIAIEGEGVDEEGETVQPGAVSEVTADLEPGEYTYYCPIGSHREQGMEGTLTVG